MVQKQRIIWVLKLQCSSRLDSARIIVVRTFSLKIQFLFEVDNPRNCSQFILGYNCSSSEFFLRIIERIIQHFAVCFYEHILRTKVLRLLFF